MTSDISQTQAVTAADVANLGNNTNAASASLASDFDNFLVLLTTQLQNQDPLNPTDSTEFTNQLVQFSQVEQGINTNQKLDALLQQFNQTSDKPLALLASTQHIQVRNCHGMGQTLSISHTQSLRRGNSANLYLR